jgi:hypothetical protein
MNENEYAQLKNLFTGVLQSGSNLWFDCKQH